jgi:hypothetical protein
MYKVYREDSSTSFGHKMLDVHTMKKSRACHAQKAILALPPFHRILSAERAAARPNVAVMKRERVEKHRKREFS